MYSKTKQKRFWPFLPRSSVGLHIGDRSIKFVELLGRKNLRLGRFGEISLPQGVVVQGEVKDPKKLARVLAIFKTDIGIGKAKISIPTEQIHFLRLEVPNLKKKIVDAAIVAEIDKSVAPELLFDYIVAGQTKSGYEIQVYFVPKDVLAGYLKALKMTKIKVQSFEPEVFATARALQLTREKAPTLLVDIGEERTCISIASGGVPLLVSTSKTGRASLLEILRQNLNINEREARKLLRKREVKPISLSRGGRLGKQIKQDRASAIYSYYAAVGEKIKDHYIDWHSKPLVSGVKKIEKVIVCGCGAEVGGCVDYLSRYLRDRVELANPWLSITSFESYIPEMSFAESLRYTTALGLALGNQ